MKQALLLILLLSFVVSACIEEEPEVSLQTVLAASHPKEFLGKRLKRYDGVGFRHTLFYKLKKPSVYLGRAGKDVKNLMVWIKKDPNRLPKTDLFFRIYEPLSPDYDDKILSIIYSSEIIKNTDWQSLTSREALIYGKLFEYDRHNERITGLLRAMGFQLF